LIDTIVCALQERRHRHKPGKQKQREHKLWKKNFVPWESTLTRWLERFSFSFEEKRKKYAMELATRSQLLGINTP
jgi:hypothetical protein